MRWNDEESSNRLAGRLAVATVPIAVPATAQSGLQREIVIDVDLRSC
jgi:hypothetical protein